MLYIVNCSFHTQADEQGLGHFSCLVDVGSVEEAEAAAIRLIRGVREGSDTLDGVPEIYMDEIIHVRSIPREGIPLRFQWAPDATHGSITGVLPTVDESHARAYSPPDSNADQPLLEF